MGEYYRGFKYYAGNSEQQMANALPKLQTISKDVVPTNVNEIVELYNIFLCFQEFQGSPNVSEDDKGVYRTPCQIIPQLCGQFCSTITEENIFSYFLEISINYKDEFLLLLEKYNAFERISGEKFVELIDGKYVSLARLLSHKSIVRRYDLELTQYMQNHIETADILILHLWGDASNAKNLPHSLSKEILFQIIDSYIDLEDDKVHPNVLQLIENGFDTNGFCVTDEMKLKARKRHIRYWNNQSAGLHLFQYGYEITYTSDLPVEDPIRAEFVDHTLKFTYSQQWFEDNLDYPTILNNFIWLFGFVDYQYRCAFAPSDSKISVMESLLGIRGQKYYPTSIQCRLQQELASGNLSKYYQKLLHSGIRLEDVFEWFFNEYALNEFGIKNYHFNAPSVNTTPLEKCKLMALAIDEILKQFDLWRKYGVIERELLEISSKTPPFDAIGSKQNQKYAYAKSKAMQKEMNLLFSDTFPLNKCHECKTFAELLQEHTLRKTDFEEYETENLEFLIARGAVMRNNNTLLPNKLRIKLLKDLYTKGVLCPSYLQSYQQQLSQFEEEGDIIYESTLFSRSEQQLLNQKLNKAQYVNGDDLRNKYAHGSYPLDEKKQEQDYYELLVIITLIIIKINEEFLLANTQVSNDEESK